MNPDRKVLNVYSVFTKSIPFLISFLIMGIYIFSVPSMVDRSGDANDIMQTIRTWGSEEVYPSYVLYKGVFSVYPYIWLYRLALLLGLNEFFFIRIYHCFLFSSVTALAFPYIYNKLFNEKTYNYRIIIFSLICFWLWEPNMSLSQLMVDLPSLAVFVFLICVALKIKNVEKHKLLFMILAGLLAGIIMGISGQYTLAALAVAIYIIYHIFRNKSKLGNKLLYIIVFFVGIGLVNIINIYFEKTIVDVMRNNGGWIPDGSSWLAIGYTRFASYYRVTGATIMGSRKYSAFLDYFRSNSMLEAVEALTVGNPYVLTISQYLKVFFDYPFDFLLSFFNTLFLAISADGGHFAFLPLFVSYTLLFISLCVLVKHNKNIKDYFRSEIWIVLSFILAAVIVVLFALEMRYVMQLQGLIFAVAILDNFIWNKFKSLYIVLKQMGVKKVCIYALTNANTIKFVGYFLFIIICFAYMGTLYEIGDLSGSSLLLKFK